MLSIFVQAFKSFFKLGVNFLSPVINIYLAGLKVSLSNKTWDFFFYVIESIGSIFDIISSENKFF